MKTTTAGGSEKKALKDMSEDEIRSAISRMKLEKEYKELMKTTMPVKSKKGREMVERMLSRSAEDIGTQLTRYLMGSAVNKIAKEIFKIDDNIVNPKHGQKDK